MTDQTDSVDYPNADPEVQGLVEFMEAIEQELARKRKPVKKETT